MAGFVKTGDRWFGGGLFRLFSVDCIFLQSQMVGFVKLVDCSDCSDYRLQSQMVGFVKLVWW